MAGKIETLKNLKKIAHHKVEDVQKQLGETLAAMENLALQIAALENRIAEEEANLGEDLDMRAHFERFEKRSRDKIKNLEDEIKTLRQHEAHLREELAEHFAEEKRYQILLERKEEEQRKARAKKSQAQLDEIAATRHTNQN